MCCRKFTWKNQVYHPSSEKEKKPTPPPPRTTYGERSPAQKQQVAVFLCRMDRKRNRRRGHKQDRRPTSSGGQRRVQECFPKLSVDGTFRARAGYDSGLGADRGYDWVDIRWLLLERKDSSLTSSSSLQGGSGKKKLGRKKKKKAERASIWL